MSGLRYTHGKPEALDRITKNTLCPFCKYCNSIDRTTFTCKNCGTTLPGNYGANQRVNKRGKSIVG